jgi:1-deoxy-D-xylulose-5-phosphate synthase
VSKALAQIDNADIFSHYDFSFVKPLDEEMLKKIFATYKEVITIEDGVIKGGFGGCISAYAAQNNYTLKINPLGIPDEFIEHGTVAQLQQYCGIDVKSLQDIFSAY